MKIKIRQYFNHLKPPNFGAANIKCLNVMIFIIFFLEVYCENLTTPICQSYKNPKFWCRKYEVLYNNDFDNIYSWRCIVKIKIRQYFNHLKPPNFGAANIKCFTVMIFIIFIPGGVL